MIEKNQSKDPRKDGGGPTFLKGFEVNESQPLWRYLSENRLKQIIQREALYFPTANQFEDIFEGSIPYKEAVRRYSQMNPRSSKRLSKFQQHELLSMDCYEDLKKWTKVSSWHMNRHESEAMWKLYSKDDKGVAIRTTVGRLKKALKPYKIHPSYKSEPTYLGKVKYIDFRRHTAAEVDDLNRFFLKRRSFAYENEFRVVIPLVTASEFCFETPESGIEVSIDLPTLIQEIYLSPFPSYRNLEKRIKHMFSKASLDIRIHVSSLVDLPVF